MQLFGMDALDVLLWVSFLILVLGALIASLSSVFTGMLPPQSGKRAGFYVSAAGWVLFGLTWLLKTPDFYFQEDNILYTVLCLLALPLTLYAAYVMVRFQRESLMVVTRCVAIGSLFYGVFNFIPWFNENLIGLTTDLTLAIALSFGLPAVKIAFDSIQLDSEAIKIITACTAIQSVAIFVGVISCVRIKWQRWLKLLAISALVIYVLNLFRNVFVLAAFGYQWFQIMPDTIAQWTGQPVEKTSFFWAHNVLAEIGSLIALFIISYAVLSAMPELMCFLRDVLQLVEIQNIKKMLRGEEVAVIAPLTQAKSK